MNFSVWPFLWFGLPGRLRGVVLQAHIELAFRVNFCPLQGSFGPFGPEVAERVRNEFPRTLGLGGSKSQKRSQKKSQINNV